MLGQQVYNLGEASTCPSHEYVFAGVVLEHATKATQLQHGLSGVWGREGWFATPAPRQDAGVCPHCLLNFGWAGGAKGQSTHLHPLAL